MKTFLNKLFGKKPVEPVVEKPVIKYIDMSTYNGKMNVIEIETETSELTTALGISHERANEIAKTVFIGFTKSDNVVGVAVYVSNIINHPNELFFASYQIAMRHREMQMSHMMMNNIK